MLGRIAKSISAAWHGARKILSALSAREGRVLAGMALCALALLVFLRVTDEIIFEGEHQFDRTIAEALRSPLDAALPAGPAWGAEVARDITSLGSTSVLTIVTLGTIFFLVLVRKLAMALYVAASAVGGTLLVQSLKGLFGRARPDFVPDVAAMASHSFPSGHSSMSAIVYLTLAGLIARQLKPLAQKTYVVGLAASVTMLVGLSRVYLGFHWPSDVVAGWALGAGWALLCWSVAEWFAHEAPTPAR